MNHTLPADKSLLRTLNTEIPRPQLLLSESLYRKKRRPLDAAVYVLIYLFSGAVAAMVLYFVYFILHRGLGGISWDFLMSAPNPIEKTIGILPSIIHTLYIVLLALLIAVPVGVGGAVYICEYAKNKRLIRIIEFTTETLSGIPSIIFGIFGYVFFCIFLGWKISLLSGAFTLTLIVLPTIIRTSSEALKSVPRSYREAAMGIGSTKWYMIRTVILPNASRGILTAVILATGRIIGESAALILVAGGSGMYLPRGNFIEQIMSGGSTLSVELYIYAYNRGQNDTGFSIAIVLLALAIVMNIAVKWVNRHIERTA